MTYPSANSYGLWADPIYIDGLSFTGVPYWFGYWWTNYGLNTERESKDTVARSLLDNYIKGYQKLINYDTLKVTSANPLLYELLDKDLDYKQYMEGLTIRFLIEKGQKIPYNANLKLSSINDPSNGYPLLINKLEINETTNTDDPDINDIYYSLEPINPEDLQDNLPYYATLIKNYNYSESNTIPIKVGNTYPDYYWVIQEKLNPDTLNKWLYLNIKKVLEDVFGDFEAYLKTCLEDIQKEIDKDTSDLEQEYNDLQEQNHDCELEYFIKPIYITVSGNIKDTTRKLTLTEFALSKPMPDVSLIKSEIFYIDKANGQLKVSTGNSNKYTITIGVNPDTSYIAYGRYTDSNNQTVTSPKIAFVTESGDT